MQGDARHRSSSGALIQKCSGWLGRAANFRESRAFDSRDERATNAEITLQPCFTTHQRASPTREPGEILSGIETAMHKFLSPRLPRRNRASQLVPKERESRVDWWLGN